MRRYHIFIALGLATSLATASLLLFPLRREPAPEPTPALPTQVQADHAVMQRLIDEEIEQLLQSDELMALLDSRIDQKLRDVDWSQRITGADLSEILRQTVLNKDDILQEVPLPPDSNASASEKIDHILFPFKGANSYYRNNHAVKELRELIESGEITREDITSRLYNLVTNTSQGGWAMESALMETLEPLLTSDDHAMIIDLFSKGAIFDDSSIYHDIDAIGPLTLARIKESTGRSLDHRLKDLVLYFNEEELPAVLSEKIAKGEMLGDAFELLERVHGADLITPLRQATQTAKTYSDKTTVAQFSMKRGISESIDLAIDVLKADDKGSSYYREEMRTLVQQYFRVNGTDADLAKWLGENRDNLIWEAANQTFIINETNP
ncbi:MAG: hypothetical protein AAGH40_00885 [Verrucomicrobiota bacterium]